jgi:hypothetical protein
MTSIQNDGTYPKVRECIPTRGIRIHLWLILLGIAIKISRRMRLWEAPANAAGEVVTAKGGGAAKARTIVKEVAVASFAARLKHSSKEMAQHFCSIPLGLIH